MAQIPVVVKPLLKPHLENLEQKMKPGMTILLWTSMNIDGYLHHIHSVSWGLSTPERLNSRISKATSISLVG